jgi:hypothetical protein
MKQSTYPDMGIRGFTHDFPKPLEGFCDGSSIEPLVIPGLLEALAYEAPGVLFTVEVVWPRVLTPDDGALVSGVGIIDLPTNGVRGD